MSTKKWPSFSRNFCLRWLRQGIAALLVLIGFYQIRVGHVNNAVGVCFNASIEACLVQKLVASPSIRPTIIGRMGGEDIMLRVQCKAFVEQHDWIHDAIFSSGFCTGLIGI
jgi:hypothetical protein